jgi:hypothetical protein
MVRNYLLATHLLRRIHKKTIFLFLLEFWRLEQSVNIFPSLAYISQLYQTFSKSYLTTFTNQYAIQCPFLSC